jgi:septal ring factor EnvC (AmiA/AmiB activator)
VPPTCAIKSPASGKVLFAGDFKGYQGVVILSLDTGRRLIVAGLGNLDVRRGEIVRRGATLGTTSATGAPALTAAFRESAAGRSLLYFDLRNADGASERIVWFGTR